MITSRKRLLEHAAAEEFFRSVVRQAGALHWLSNEHYRSVVVPRTGPRLRPETPPTKMANPARDQMTGNPTVNFHGERRSNQTHQSTTDPEALLARKGKGREAKLYYSGNALAENRNFLQKTLDQLDRTVAIFRDHSFVTQAVSDWDQSS